MLRRLVAGIAGLLLVLAGCSGENGTASSASASDGTPLTIGLTYVPDIQFSPFYVAEQKGYFADEGLNVTLRHHGAQESLLGALGSGEEGVVVAGGDEMMVGRSQNINVVDWGTLYQTYPVSLIVPKDSSIISVADLAGKTVGVPGTYGETYYALKAALTEAGLNDKVNVQTIGYTQQAALTTKKVDAVVGFINSDAVSIERAGTPVRTIELVKGGVPLVGAGLGSLEPNVKTHRDTYAAVLRALRHAVEFMTSHPEETVKITQRYVPSLAEADNAAQARAVLDATLRLYGNADQLGAQNADTWAQQASFLEGEFLEKPVAAQDAFVDLTK